MIAKTDFIAAYQRLVVAIAKRIALVFVVAASLLQSDLAVAQSSLPDLKVTAMSVTGIIYKDNGSWAINTSYTVTNVGTAVATSGWSDMGYLSANGVLDNNSQNSYPLSFQSTLAVGASYTVNSQFTTSTVLPSGNYTFFVKADGHSAKYNGLGYTNTDNGGISESDETNNTASAAVTLARPDLKVTAMSVTGVIYKDNGSWAINTSYTVTNVGTVDATSGWADMGYLSANGVLDNNSQNSYPFAFPSSLAAGASYTVNSQFTTSTSLPTGNYTFFVKADGHSPKYNGAGYTNTDNGGLIEGDETNNTASTTVTLARPDLKVTAMSVTGVTYKDNGSWAINTSYTVTNIGSVAATSGWADMGYLSANGVLDNSSQNSYPLSLQSGLAAGASYTVNSQFTTSTSLAAGNYVFFVKADGHSPAYNGAGNTNTDSGGLIEGDETNNTASTAVTLARPDLKITAMSVASVGYHGTGSWVINTSYTVTNVGTVAATSGWADMGYLSANGALDNNSQNSYPLSLQSGLAAGASYTINSQFTTSTSLPAGSYTFFVKADGHSPAYNGAGYTNTDNGGLIEGDETNNVASAAVTLARPDLVVSAMTVDGIVPNNNGSYQMSVSYTVTNVGTVAATEGWSDMGYLSTNGVLDNASQSNNYYIYASSGLAAGASYTVHAVYTTLTTTSSGNYTFFLKADGHNPVYNGAGSTNSDSGSILEVSETNNTASQAIYLPIRTTTTMTSSVNPVKVGQSTTLTATVVPSNVTGKVSFYKYYRFGTRLIGTANVVGGSASLPTTFTEIGFGKQPLIATYSGDAVYYTSTSDQLAQSLTSGVGTPTLTSSLGTIVSGRPLTLTALLPSTAKGSVDFFDGSVKLGSAAVSTGSAVMTTASLTTTGIHPLTASYGGDTNFASGVSATLNETVTAITKATTTTSLTATPGFVVSGGSVDLVVTISGALPGGSVAILDGSLTLVTIPVVGGAAKLALPLTTTGVHTLSAKYAGDNYNNTSTSTSVSIEVNETATSSPGLMTWIYGYDASGNRWIDVDPNGHETDRNFDKLERPFQILSPFFTGTSGPRAVLGINYDGQNRISSVLDPRALTTSYGLDGFGNSLKLTSPDTGVATSTFDENGNLLTRTDSRGNLTKYSYDLANRLTSATYASGTATVYTYDGGATPPPYSKGHLTLVTDESGSTAFTYDFRGEIVKKVQTISGTSLTTSYTWGSSGAAVGALTSITYPSGARVNYAYDTYGRISAVTVNPANSNGVGTNTGTTINLLSGVTYNGSGEVTGWLWNDGVPYKRTFDAFGRLSSYLLGNPAGTGASAGLTRTLSYDNATQILAYTHTSASGAQTAFDQRFTYDPLGRLITNTQGTTSYAYTYDANGNRTANKIGSTSYSSTIATTSNRLSSAQSAAGTRSFMYDNAGNETTDGVATYTYNARGRMASAKVGTGTVSYLYSGLDRRVSKTGPTTLVPSGAAYYAYDESGRVIGEYGTGLVLVYETVYLGDQPVSVLKQSGAASTSTLVTTPYNVFGDQVGAPRMVTRSTDEAIMWRWDSAEAFGATSPNTNPNGLGVFVYNQRFPGQIFDAETGNFYNGHRDYNSGVGRYVQSDPVGLAGGSLSTFAYVNANPLTLVDSEGLQVAGPMGFPLPIPPTPQQEALNKKLAQQFNEALTKALRKDDADEGAKAPIQTRSKEPDCQCTGLPSREQAFFEAATYAGVGSGWTRIGWEMYNYPKSKSAQKSYTEFRQRIGNDPYGYENPAGGEVVEHPSDGEHPCPHFHAKRNLADKSRVFAYDPSRP